MRECNFKGAVAKTSQVTIRREVNVLCLRESKTCSRERLCELFICESLRKLRKVCKSLQNQFRLRKLVKVFLHRTQRAKAKAQAAKVLRKEFAKEEPIRKTVLKDRPNDCS